MMATIGAILAQGFEHHRADRLDRAEACYLQVLRAAPELPEALHLLGLLARRRGDDARAAALIGRAVAAQPDFPEAWYNLGNALAARGRLAEAEAAYRAAIALKPDQVLALKNLGNILQGQGRPEEAIAAYRAALALDPREAECLNNLASALQAQGRVKGAIAAFLQTLAMRPGYAEAWNNYAQSLLAGGRLGDGILAFETALRLAPDYAECWSNYGNALFSQARGEEAQTAFHRALTLQPDLAPAHSNLIINLNYLSDVSRERVFAAHRAFDARHCRPLAALARPHAHSADPERRLKVGYYSPDFRRHSCAFFFLPLVEHRDPSQVEITCYASLKSPDAYSDRIRALADRWVNVSGWPEARLAGQVRGDGIDILIDMAGHFADHKLLAFAQKPAPVQVTWLGYPNTTGLTSIGYRLTDALADPEGEADRFHTETLVRLPRGFLCYTPPGDAPRVVAPPCLTGAPVTFGSFNNLNKMRPEVVALWSAVLRRVPGARLALKSMPLGDPATRDRILALFAGHGIAAERIEILPWTAHPAGHLALYAGVDVALDPFPYNGTTTTCEALWMGVPVVALAGDRHAGRVGVSLLTRAGLPELVAPTPEDYVALAAALASDHRRLSALRLEMRERLARSPLLDAAGFARQMEGACRLLWRRWCAGSQGR